MSWFTEGRHALAFDKRIVVDEIVRRYFRNDPGVRSRLLAFAADNGLVVV